MFYKKFKVLIIILFFTNCSLTVKFVKSHTKALFCFPEFSPDKKYISCNSGYMYANSHPFYNRIESTCTTSFMNKEKRSECKRAGYKYYITSHISNTHSLYLLEIFYPEEMLKRYQNPFFINPSRYYKEVFKNPKNPSEFLPDLPVVPKYILINQLKEYIIENGSLEKSHCYTKYKSRIFTLVDQFEQKFMYEKGRGYIKIGNKIRNLLDSVMRCSKAG